MHLHDLSEWTVGQARYACIVGLVTGNDAVTPQAVKRLLAQHEELAHVTVEINRCQE